MTSGTAPHRTWQQRAACADMDKAFRTRQSADFTIEEPV